MRLIGPNGSQEGIKALPEALTYAKELDLDLVEVAPDASPPVCRVMDYPKFKYEQGMQRKESRRKAMNVIVKEMKFRPKIDEHDYTTKTKHVERFLAEGSKVKITIMFRGRELAHPDLGMKILNRIAEQVGEMAVIEAMPKIDGRNMVMVLAPAAKRPVAKAARSSAKASHDQAEQPEAPPQLTAQPAAEPTAEEAVPATAPATARVTEESATGS